MRWMRWMRPFLAIAVALAVAVTLAARGGGNEGSGTAKAAQAPGKTAAKRKTPPLIGGFYNEHSVTYLLTDVSQRKDAKALSKATGFPVSYVPALNRVPDGATARLYLFTNGVAGPNPFGFQPNVLDSVPGEPGYSPLWRVYAVSWKAAATPRELKSEKKILAAERGGELTIKRTPLIKNSPVIPGR